MAGMTAYIVDDKRLIRESLARTVNWEQCGFHVIGTAGDGLEAEEEIRRLRPDLIVTDIRMPGGDGLSLAEHIRDFLPQSRVIIITGHEEFEYAQRSLRAGAVDIILKPIRNEDLERAASKAADEIRRALEHSDALREDPGELSEEAASNALVRSIIIYVEENLSGDLRLSTLAALYRVTSSHLSRTFKRETGTNYLEYVTGKRVALAREMLADPSWRVSEISSRCGFPNPARLTHAFKEATGLTPSEYRSRCSVPEIKKNNQ